MCLGWVGEGVVGEQIYNCLVFLVLFLVNTLKYYPEEVFPNI